MKKNISNGIGQPVCLCFRKMLPWQSHRCHPNLHTGFFLLVEITTYFFCAFCLLGYLPVCHKVEDIKHENKLWTNDSLHLKLHLIIPVSNGSGHTEPVGNAAGHSALADQHIQAEHSALADRRVQPASAADNGCESPAQSTQGLDKSSVASLFASFDSQFADIKSSVSHLQRSSSPL